MKQGKSLVKVLEEAGLFNDDVPALNLNIETAPMKSEIEHKLETLVNYYNLTRQVGHTETMMKGVETLEDCIVVAGTREQSREFERRANCLSFPPSSINTGLRTRRKPLVFDNFALQSLFQESLEEIQKLKKLLDKEKSKSSNEKMIWPDWVGNKKEELRPANYKSRHGSSMVEPEVIVDRIELAVRHFINSRVSAGQRVEDITPVEIQHIIIQEGGSNPICGVHTDPRTFHMVLTLRFYVYGEEYQIQQNISGFELPRR